MKRGKQKTGKPRVAPIIRSFPEAEEEVRIFTPATRSALRQSELAVEPRKAIVSINGRDVEKVPDTKDRAA